MSRTRCSVLHGAPQSRDPRRCAQCRYLLASRNFTGNGTLRVWSDRRPLNRRFRPAVLSVRNAQQHSRRIGFKSTRQDRSFVINRAVQPDARKPRIRQIRAVEASDAMPGQHADGVGPGKIGSNQLRAPEIRPADCGLTKVGPGATALHAAARFRQRFAPTRPVGRLRPIIQLQPVARAGYCGNEYADESDMAWVQSMSEQNDRTVGKAHELGVKRPPFPTRRLNRLPGVGDQDP